MPQKYAETPKNRILGPRPEWENSQVKVNYREITIINNQFLKICSCKFTAPFLDFYFK